MKIIKGMLCTIAMATALTVPVFGARVNMNLTYDGTTRLYSAEEINLYVNGKPITVADVPPVSIDNRVYVPARDVFEPLGATVDWKGDTREIYIGYQEDLVVLTLNSTIASLNGSSITMEAAPKIINNKTMVPVRFAAEALGIPVDWQKETRSAYIGEKPDTAATVGSGQDTPASGNSGATSQATAGTAIDASTLPIVAQDYAETNVTGISAAGNVFTITASGPISDVQKQVLEDNRLVLDITKTNNQLSQSSYTGFAYGGVSEIRHSQFQSSPEKITRIVFDLTGAVRFEVSLSSDRKTLQVKFQESAIQDIQYAAVGGSEQVTITGNTAPVPVVARMFSPNRLVFDFAGTTYEMNQTEFAAGGNLTDKIRASQYDASTVRVVLDLKDYANYAVTYSGSQTIIELKPATFKNISYANESRGVITLKKAGSGITAGGIRKNDDYFNRSYTLTLPGDYASYYGYGDFDIQDGILNKITIGPNGAGQTQLLIDEAKVYEFVITEDTDNIYISAYAPKDVYKNVVLIDAGHGLNDPGASANGIQEKAVNLDIVRRLHTLLENDSNIKVYATRLEDTYPQNSYRAAMANQVADIFVSVHHNSASSTKANGTEILYLNHANEVEPGLTSEKMASIFLNNMLNYMGTNNRGIIKRQDLIVLNQTTVPAVLVEVGFISNAEDAAKIADEGYRQRAAEAMYQSIRQVFQQYFE